MDKRSLENLLNNELDKLKIQIVFTGPAYKDLQKLDVHNRNFALALILAQARKNPLPRPKGSGKPLKGHLKGICKIKARSHYLRILYTAKENEGKTYMRILIIGPREIDEVYKRALNRLKKS